MSIEGMNDTIIAPEQWETIERCACEQPSETEVFIQLDTPRKEGAWYSFTDSVSVEPCGDIVRRMKQKIPQMKRELER